MKKMTNNKQAKYTSLNTIKHYLYLLFLLTLFLLISGFLNVVQKVNGQTVKKVDEKKNALSQANEAAEAFVRVMGIENSDVFISLLKETQCAVVFPSVSEAAYLEIKDGRRGMASCRLDKTWGASVFVVLKTATLNKERRLSDLVFFFKNTDDLTNMLSDRSKFGKAIKFKEFDEKITKFEDGMDVIIFGNKDSDINVETLNQGSIQEGKKYMRIVYGQGTEISEWIKEPTKFAPSELYSFNYSLKNFERGVK